MVNMTKKGQKNIAVPAILVAMIAFMFIYLILVHPVERGRVLPPISPDEEIINDVDVKEIIYSSSEFIEIGQAEDETVFEYDLDDLYVSYPKRERILNSFKLDFRASILRDDSQVLNIRNLNVEETDELILKFNTTEVSGSPEVSIIVNETLVSSHILKEEVSRINIPTTLLEENANIEILFEHKGYFWSRDSAEINTDIIKVYYEAENIIETQRVPLSRGNIMGSEIQLSFLPEEAIAEGEFIIKINDQIIFADYVEKDELVILNERIDDSGIKVGENVFVFETDKGGVYSITDLKMQFIAARTPVSEHVYSFDMERKHLESNENIMIGVRTNRIIKPGHISIQLGVDGPTYLFSQDELIAGTWSYLEIKEEDLDYLNEWDNKITISSPTGRYRLNGFTVFLVESDEKIDSDDIIVDADKPEEEHNNVNVIDENEEEKVEFSCGYRMEECCEGGVCYYNGDWLYCENNICQIHFECGGLEQPCCYNEPICRETIEGVELYSSGENIDNCYCVLEEDIEESVECGWLEGPCCDDYFCGDILSCLDDVCVLKK